MDNLTAAVIQKYKFRGNTEGVMVGGMPMKDVLTGNIEGGARIEEFSVPVGLYVDVTAGKMTGGGANSMDAKIIIGEAIDNDRFDKLYGGVVNHIVKKTGKTMKKR